MKRVPYLIFSIVFILHFISSPAQPYDPGKVNKKALQLYNQAMERANDGNLTMAAGLLLQCIQTDNKDVDAYLSLAGVYGQLKSHKSSIEYYEKAFVTVNNITVVGV